MTDYRKKYSEPKIEEVDKESVKEVDELQELQEELANEAAAEPEESTEQQSKPVYGVVRNCSKLNVRKSPSKDEEIVCVLNEGSEVCIDEEQSTEDWYSISNAAGIEGFCMKQFVEVLS